MDQQKIEMAILLDLYEAHFLGDSRVVLKDLSEKNGWDTKVFSKAERHLRNEGLIAFRTISAHEITPSGVIHCEENNIAPKELSAQNNKARRLLLESLNKANEDEDREGEVYYTELLETTDLDKNLMMTNLHLLVDLYYIESPHGTGYYRLTDRGIDAIKDWTGRKSIATEFDDISKLTPQARGRAFQKLVAKIIERFGWSQDEGLRTSHEEMDVIVFREREYYLVECKWGNEPMEAAVVRELHGKLSNRADVRGIVVSMSGFTEGAATQVIEYVSNRVILLFGPKDVNSLIYGKIAFDDLLNRKYKELITRKKVVFD